jgi:hypothetical protein
VVDSDTSDTASGDDGGADDTGTDSSAPILLDPDASVGGLCVVVEAGDPFEAGGGDEAGPGGDGGVNVTCGCTRRPGVGNSFQCPAGVGEYSSASVGPAGGTVALQGRQGVESGASAQVTFAPGAIASPATITLIETAIAPPYDLLDWSPVYLVEPAGLALASPATLQLPASNSLSTAGDLSIWFSPDGSCFTRVADSYTNAGFMQGSTRQLGYLMVGAPRATSTCP